MKHLLLFLVLFLTVQNAQAQDYQEALEEGKRLYAQELFYEAYLRFNAAEVNSKQFQDAKAQKANQESRVLLEKAVKGITIQQAKTDSLLKRNQAIIDQFYFYDGRLALAYKDDNYGFINKKGEVVIEYKYEQATNFDEQTGYAKVGSYMSGEFWLSPEGEEYPIATPLNDLPKIQKNTKSESQTPTTQKVEDLASYKTTGNSNHHQALNEGIDKFHQRAFYDAFVRFNATTYSQDKALAKIGEELKQKSIAQIRLSFTQAEDALNGTKRLLSAFYYYDNKFALAYKNKQFYFINKQAEAVEKLGKWDRAEQFNWKGFAKVEKDNKQYLLDTLSNTYRVAYKIEDLNPETDILEINDSLGTLMWQEIPTEIFTHIRLKFLILEYDLLSTLPAEIGNLQNLTYLSLGNNQLKTLPKEIGNLQNLTYLSLDNNQLKTLPKEIGNLKNLTYLSLGNNQLKTLPKEIGNLQNLTYLSLGNNQLTILPAEIGQLKNLTELWLEENQLTTFPAEIGKLQKLTGLYLQGNPITPEEQKKIEKLLPNCEILFK